MVAKAVTLVDIYYHLAVAVRLSCFAMNRLQFDFRLGISSLVFLIRKEFIMGSANVDPFDNYCIVTWTVRMNTDGADQPVRRYITIPSHEGPAYRCSICDFYPRFDDEVWPSSGTCVGGS